MKTIIVYRYFVTYCKLRSYEVEVEKETPTFYFLKPNSYINNEKRVKIRKDEEDQVVLKDPCHYPYIDFYSTENPSREYAIKMILQDFKNNMEY